MFGTWQPAAAGREALRNFPDNRKIDPTVPETCSTGAKIGATVGNKTLRVTETDRSGNGYPYSGGQVGNGREEDDRSANNGESGIDTGRMHGTGLAVESWFPDTLRAKGDFGVDASTPMTGVND